MSVKYNVVEHGKPGHPTAPKKYYPSAVASRKINLRMVAKRAAEMSTISMPDTIAELLILAGIQTIKKEEFLDVWDVGWGPRIVMLVTFVMTLMVPVQYAVFGGLILSILVYLVSSSQDVKLTEIIPNNDGTFREGPLPQQLPSDAVTLLSVSGNLFYAAVNTLEKMLPSAIDATRPVVIALAPKRLNRKDFRQPGGILRCLAQGQRRIADFGRRYTTGQGTT